MNKYLVTIPSLEVVGREVGREVGMEVGGLWDKLTFKSVCIFTLYQKIHAQFSPVRQLTKTLQDIINDLII